MRTLWLARPRPGALAIAALLIVLTALSAVLLGGAALNFDGAYHLLWGELLVDGTAPDITSDSSPTQHPLTIVAAVVLAVVPGLDPADGLHLLSHVGLAAFILAAALIALELAGVGAALVTALTCATIPAATTATAIAFQDVTAAALVLGALALELRRPRRGTAPLLLLGAAGLLRPEAWGVALAYWAWCSFGAGRRPEWRLAALAVSAPVLWALSDLLLTGEPLTSFTRTREGAAVAQRTTGLNEAPEQLARNLRDALYTPTLLIALAGAAVLAAFAVPRIARRIGLRGVSVDRAQATTGALALSGAGFIVIAAGELSLLTRYVLLSSALLAVALGVAAGTWALVEDRRLRLAGLLLALGVGAALVVDVPRRADVADAELAIVQTEGDVQDELAALLDDPRAKDAVSRCGRVAVTSYRTRPYVGLRLGVPADDVLLADDPRRLTAPAALVLATTLTSRQTLESAGRPLALVPAPSSARSAVRSANWAIITTGC